MFFIEITLRSITCAWINHFFKLKAYIEFIREFFRLLFVFFICLNCDFCSFLCLYHIRQRHILWRKIGFIVVTERIFQWRNYSRIKRWFFTVWRLFWTKDVNHVEADEWNYCRKKVFHIPWDFIEGSWPNIKHFLTIAGTLLAEHELSPFPKYNLHWKYANKAKRYSCKVYYAFPYFGFHRQLFKIEIFHKFDDCISIKVKHI